MPCRPLNSSPRFRLVLLFAAALGAGAAGSPAEDATTAAPVPDFHREVAPVLEVSCLECHRTGKDKGGLVMESRASLLGGGDSGPAIIEGNPSESLLVERIALPADHDDIMPPEDDPLPGTTIDVIERWIAAGAPWPEGVVLEPKKPGEVPTTIDDDKPLRAIRVFPEAVSLETSADFHRIVVVATYEDDTTRDVTAAATYQIHQPGLVAFDRFTFRPLADGETSATITYRGAAVELPLRVIRAGDERAISFRLDVMPVFMRENCNTGSCHGAARGQDRFMLSLFGYDPAGDYFRLTRELSGRRINLAIPEESLLVEKALEKVPHSGGKLFEAEGPSWQTLVSWIRAGAPDDPPDVATPTGIRILPEEAVLEGAEATQQMTVVATYSDGSDRDVTRLAVFSTNNDRSASVDRDGLVTSGVRGEAFIMARFDAFTQGSQVIVIPDDLDYQRPEIPEQNYIDTLVHEKLHKLRILPSEVCSDEVFLRRAFLDIVGMLPTEEEFRAFMSNPSPDKREQLVDELLSRKEFTEMWVMKFAELLQMRTVNNGNNRVSYKAALLYHGWLKERFARNVPMNEIVKELLSATGGTFSNPATNYYQTETDTLKVAENVAQVFMGMRLQCAQCHNHPFDRWTMNDYYGFAAFFTQIGRKQAEDPRETIVFNSGGGEVAHPVTKQNAQPTFLGGDVADTAGKDRRKILVDWLASPDNPFFATNLANIVWSHFFGIGIIDPVDDVRISNPASNRRLLDELGRRFTEYDYDFRRLVKDICTSRTYQLSTRTNDTNSGDDRNFSHALIRRQRAEVLLDTISQVTETQNKFRGLPLGARAVQIADGNTSTYFLTTFGRATRETVCSCEVKMDPNLGQALHLINGETVHNNIQRGNLVRRMLDEGRTPDQVVESLYLRCFSRPPTDEERAQLGADIAAEEDRNRQREYLEDVFWAILNAKEFLFNH